jgi:hypothetical protein
MLSQAGLGKFTATLDVAGSTIAEHPIRLKNGPLGWAAGCVSLNSDRQYPFGSATPVAGKIIGTSGDELQICYTIVLQWWRACECT